MHAQDVLVWCHIFHSYGDALLGLRCHLHSRDPPIFLSWLLILFLLFVGFFEVLVFSLSVKVEYLFSYRWIFLYLGLACNHLTTCTSLIHSWPTDRLISYTQAHPCVLRMAPTTASATYVGVELEATRIGIGPGGIRRKASELTRRPYVPQVYLHRQRFRFRSQ